MVYTLLITILLLSICFPLLEAIRTPSSTAFCNTSRSLHHRRKSVDGNKNINWCRSSRSQLSFVASSTTISQNGQYRHDNPHLGRTNCIAAASRSKHQPKRRNSSTTLSFRCALNRIRQLLVQRLSKGLKLLRALILASILLVPSIASSSSSSASPSSYYLQNKPLYHQQHQKRSEISIQTHSSQPYPNNNNKNTVITRRQYPQTTKFVRKQHMSSSSGATQTQKVKRTTLFIMILTLAASTFRASLRKTKIVRNVTPFGTIRNTSPLGNGVSVIRLCMAFEVDSDEAKRLLNKLYLEEKELYANISMLSQDNDLQVQQQQQQQRQRLDGAHSFRQQAIGKYVSNVASTFLQYTNCIRYGTMESIRVPFVEEAVKEFRQVAKEDRHVFADTAASQKKRRENVMHPESKEKKFLVATILLSIKGDRTSVPLPFGILRQRDVARGLSRIATDATVEGCLVGSEISWFPKSNTLIPGDEDDGDIIDDMLMSEKDVLSSFPDLISLT